MFYFVRLLLCTFLICTQFRWILRSLLSFFVDTILSLFLFLCCFISHLSSSFGLFLWVYFGLCDLGCECEYNKCKLSSRPRVNFVCIFQFTSNFCMMIFYCVGNFSENNNEYFTNMWGVYEVYQIWKLNFSAFGVKWGISCRFYEFLRHITRKPTYMEQNLRQPVTYMTTMMIHCVLCWHDIFITCDIIRKKMWHHLDWLLSRSENEVFGDQLQWWFSWTQFLT